jgi:UDP-N-acetylglucosamine--N-acetylmuramyl-(pentapeptide) pyrophosphoryl-undecaprenol N-acetylglucosamine transferase
MEERMAAEANITFHPLKLHPFMGKPLGTRIKAMAGLPPAMFKAYRLLKKLRAQAAVAFGGYVSAAIGLMAPRARVPLVVQEQNTIPGRTTRMLAKRAVLVCAGMEPVRQHLGDVTTVLYTGNPVRDEIERLSGAPKSLENGVHLLVMGGSQGASFLNEVAPMAVSQLKSAGKNVTVHHQVGRGDPDPVISAYKDMGVTARVEPFITDMAAAYAEADIALARSGALSVSELWVANIPSVFVPFPHAVDDHQFHNGACMEATSGARVIDQKNATPESLASLMESLTTDQRSYQILRNKLRASAPKNASERIASEILRAAGLDEAKETMSPATGGANV